MSDQGKRRQMIAEWGSRLRTPKVSKRVPEVPDSDPGGDDELTPVTARIDFDQGRASAEPAFEGRAAPKRSASASESCGKRKS